MPYQAVIGEREAAAGQVAVRLRDGRRLPPLPADAALAGIAAHVAAHRTDLWDAALIAEHRTWPAGYGVRMLRRIAAASRSRRCPFPIQ